MVERNGFAERLRQAQARHGLERPESRSVAPKSPWGLGFRAGVEVVSALIVGVGLGWLLDRWLGTFPWLFVLCFFLGGAAGVLNVYRVVMPRRRPTPD